VSCLMKSLFVLFNFLWFYLINGDLDVLIVERVPAEPYKIDTASNSSSGSVHSDVDSECEFVGAQNVRV
jgi:hypothetical protein